MRGSHVLNPWAAHYQSAWRERAGDTRLDLWLRVAALAFAHHKRNGHANFESGEIAKILGVSAQSVSRAIKKAKELGFIAGESNARCLVVPPWAVWGGPGHPNDRCRFHPKKFTVPR
jgi:MarR family